MHPLPPLPWKATVRRLFVIFRNTNDPLDHFALSQDPREAQILPQTRLSFLAEALERHPAEAILARGGGPAADPALLDELERACAEAPGQTAPEDDAPLETLLEKVRPLLKPSRTRRAARPRRQKTKPAPTGHPI